MNFKKSLIAVALVFFMTAAIITVSPSSSADPSGTWIDAGNYQTDWYDGKESEDSFYIQDAADLAGLSYLTNHASDRISFSGKTIHLPTNGTIDLSAHYWIPIGLQKPYFYGSIDGNDCTITGLNISSEYKPDENRVVNPNYIGFISAYGNTDSSLPANVPVIENINFTNVNLSPVKSGAGIIGKVQSSATIQNCSVSGTMSLQQYEGEYADKSAGIVGLINADENSTIKIESCNNKMIVILPDDATKGGTGIGGILGKIESYPNVEIINCTNDGDISGRYKIGGIIGDCGSAVANITITNCINSGTVNALGSGSTLAENAVGGIAGYAANSVFIGCTNNGDVVAGSEMNNVGGIVGYMPSGSIEGCTNNGNIKGGSKTGGIVGYFVLDEQDQKIIVDDCLNAGNVSGQGHVGGIIGTIAYGNASDSSGERPFQTTYCINTGNVMTAGDDTTVVGGIVGYNNYGTNSELNQEVQNIVSDCINLGTVPSGSGQIVGTNQSILDKYRKLVNGQYEYPTIPRPADITDCYWQIDGNAVAVQLNTDNVDVDLTGAGYDASTGNISGVTGTSNISQVIDSFIEQGVPADGLTYGITFDSSNSTVEGMTAIAYHEIALPSTSAEGYVFVGWTYSGIVYEAGDSFIVRSDTEFTAVWEAEISLGVTIGSQSGQDGSFTLTASVTGAPAGSQPSYQWYLDGVAIDGATSGTYITTTGGTYEVVVTVTTDNQEVGAEATFGLIIEEGGSTTVTEDDEGNSVTTVTRPDGSSTVTTESEPTQTVNGTTMTTTTVVEKDSDGNLTSSSIDVKIEVTAGSEPTVTVPSADLSAAVDSVSGQTDSTITVSVSAKASVTIPADAATALSGSGAELRVTTGSGTITMSVDVVRSLSSQMTGYNLVIDLNDDVSNDTDLNAQQQSVVGDNTVFELTATIGESPVHELGGMVSYDVPESLIPDDIEKEDLVIFWVDDYGNLEVMKHQWVGETLRMWTDHFSYFVMGTASMIPEEPEPEYPPFNPGWSDDDYVPLPPVIVQEPSENNDDATTTVACAAAAVVAAIMAVFLIMEYRKK